MHSRRLAPFTAAAGDGWMDIQVEGKWLVFKKKEGKMLQLCRKQVGEHLYVTTASCRETSQATKAVVCKLGCNFCNWGGWNPAWGLMWADARKKTLLLADIPGRIKAETFAKTYNLCGQKKKGCKVDKCKCAGIGKPADISAEWHHRSVCKLSVARQYNNNTI